MKQAGEKFLSKDGKCFWSDSWNCWPIISLDFLGSTSEAEVFRHLYGTKVTQWIRAILLGVGFADFEQVKEDFANAQVLQAQFNFLNYPVHNTSANLLLKMPVTEAAEERAFSRRKIVHTSLRASPKTDNLESQLFIRYSFEQIKLKIKSVESEKKTRG